MAANRKVTETMLYHFVKSIVDRWERESSYKEKFAVMLVESLAATLKRIEEQDGVKAARK